MYLPQQQTASYHSLELHRTEDSFHPVAIKRLMNARKTFPCGFLCMRGVASSPITHYSQELRFCLMEKA